MTNAPDDAWIPQHHLALTILYAIADDDDGSRTLQCEFDCDECGSVWEHQSRHAAGVTVAIPIDAQRCPTCEAEGASSLGKEFGPTVGLGSGGACYNFGGIVAAGSEGC
jgi:hypothetical protein